MITLPLFNSETLEIDTVIIKVRSKTLALRKYKLFEDALLECNKIRLGHAWKLLRSGREPRWGKRKCD